jgi:hypothetical protein
MATYKHLRSSTANKRPTTSITDGQLAINTNTASPGLFFKDSAGTGIVKVGPVHVGTTAPNATPAAGGSSGNYLGEQWLDTSVSPAQMKVWNGSAWVGIVADELPVSKLQDGDARQLLQTDAAGTGVEWTSNVDVPGTLDVTSTATFDSIARHPLGSAAAPTLTFTGDPNTGIYSPGADQVAVATNGTGRLFVDASGNVGVGTSSPVELCFCNVQPLPIQYKYPALKLIFIILAYGKDPVQFNHGSERLHHVLVRQAIFIAKQINRTSTAFVTWWSANTERLRITSAGLVGIGATERARIDSSGRLLVGTSSGRAVGFSSLQAPVQVETTTAAAYTAVNNTNDANGCYVSIAKTRGTSAGAVTAVQNNDELGAIRISGSDGTGFVVGAQIIAAVDGTPGTNDLPTRLVFSTTADGASSPTERMRINNSGNVGIGNAYIGTAVRLVTKGNGTSSSGYAFEASMPVRLPSTLRGGSNCSNHWKARVTPIGLTYPPSEDEPT